MTITSPPTGIDAVLTNAVERGLVVGVTAAAADASGVSYEGAAGRRSVEADTPMTTDTVCWIASMTKALTGTAAMQQVEQGRLELDAPIGAVLPQLTDVKVLDGWGDDGGPTLRAARRPVTLRHLLTHTSGFSYNMWSSDCDRYITHAGLPSILSCESASLDQPLMFDPGERWEYGIGVDFAGLAVEAVTGQDLDAYLRDHVFVPLGMADTGFAPGPDQQARMASMHARLPDGGFAPITFGLPAGPEFFMGGGGLYSTAGDYLRLLRMLLGGGTLDGAQVLRPDTVHQMTQNQIGDLMVTPMISIAPEASNDCDFFPDVPKKWGLTFFINTVDAPTGRRAGSVAWAGLSNCYFWADPAAQVAGVILSQSLPFVDAGAMEAFEAFERAVYAR